MNNLTEERHYNQLKRLGQKLHTPIPELFWAFEVSLDGKLIQIHKQRSHSWVRNGYNLLFSELAGKGGTADGFGAGKVSIKDQSGLVHDNDGRIIQVSQDSDGIGHAYRESAGQTAHGILVGSGENAEDFEDYALQTLIVNGSGAGQLDYAQSEEHSISYAALVLKNELVRYMNNNSGGDVNINEVALAANGRMALSFKEFVVARDKLVSTVTVPDTGQVKVTYTVQLTFPA